MNSYQITVPANTPQTSPVITDLRAGKRNVAGSIYFVPGCKGAVGARIIDHGRQVFPSSGWVYGDGVPAPFGPLSLDGPTFELTCEAWSNAVDFDQILIVTVDFL